MTLQTGRGGIGSHKHGVSGVAGRSPRHRHSVLREATQADEKDARRKRKRSMIHEPAASVRELLSRKK